MACIITGKKPSQLNDPVVAVDNTAWLVIETSDGKVCKIHPDELAFVSSEEWEFFIVPGFSGTTLQIPLTVNGGKIPASDNQIFVTSNGVNQDVGDHFNGVRNPGATQDEIEFTGPKDNKRIAVRFPRPA